MNMTGQPPMADRDAVTAAPRTSSVRGAMAPAKALLLHAIRDPATLTDLDAASLDEVMHAARQHA